MKTDGGGAAGGSISPLLYCVYYPGVSGAVFAYFVHSGTGQLEGYMVHGVEIALYPGTLLWRRKRGAELHSIFYSIYLFNTVLTG